MRQSTSASAAAGDHPNRSIALAILWLLLASPAGAVLMTPMAPLSPAPSPPTRQANLARKYEAEAKARLLAEFATKDAEPTPGMALYDVIHYDLDLSLAPASHLLTGTVLTTLRVTGSSLASVDLHLAGDMAVSGATVAGQPATFTRNGGVVTVALDRSYLTGEVLTVGVSYGGDPEGASFWWDSHGGSPWVATLSEPYGAREWWPCKDLNSDKADSVDLHVTVPAGLIVASNGSLLGQESLGASDRYHWRERYPIATYLVSLAIHPYAIIEDTYPTLAGGTMEVRHYVLPDQLTQAQAGYAVTVPILEAFAAGFGEYPFVSEKYGHAHFPWGGGMEHQTLTSLLPDFYGAWIIAHEMAHQWWGDLVTCDDFHHIWLNEGFATWSEAYWREQSEGMAGYHDEMDAAAYYGPGTIYVEETSNFSAIFDQDLSYNKASWVVHMLRHVLGDEDFFAALEAYRDAYAYGSATTEQLRDVCESISGLDLDAFFQQWIYGEYYPDYEYAWYGLDRGDSTRVSLQIDQVQTNTGLFTMPIDVRIGTDQGTRTFLVQNGEAAQSYVLTVAGTAEDVQLDPEGWILCHITERTVDVPPVVLNGPVLEPNHPNPFNPTTTIPFLLPEPGPVRLRVYDLQGRLVRQLASGTQTAGRHEVVWDGRSDDGRAVASGVYLCRLEAGGVSRNGRLLLAR
jgi:aminopeptidase N